MWHMIKYIFLYVRENQNKLLNLKVPYFQTNRHVVISSQSRLLLVLIAAQIARDIQKHTEVHVTLGMWPDSNRCWITLVHPLAIAISCMMSGIFSPDINSPINTPTFHFMSWVTQTTQLGHARGRGGQTGHAGLRFHPPESGSTFVRIRVVDIQNLSTFHTFTRLHVCTVCWVLFISSNLLNFAIEGECNTQHFPAAYLAFAHETWVFRQPFLHWSSNFTTDAWHKRDGPHSDVL